jgi:hypothetical protein
LERFLIKRPIASRDVTTLPALSVSKKIRRPVESFRPTVAHRYKTDGWRYFPVLLDRGANFTAMLSGNRVSFWSIATGDIPFCEKRWRNQYTK